MKELFRPDVMKRVAAPACLVLLSFIPLMLIGFILDVLLVRFFSWVKGNTVGLNSTSLWVFDHLAGYRFLPQELMAGFWFLMIISLIIIFFTVGDPHLSRFRFLYSFLFIWGAAVSVAGFIVFACVKPFDLLLARLEETSWVGKSLPTLLIAELLIILLLPVSVSLWKKANIVRTGPPAPPSPDITMP